MANGNDSLASKLLTWFLLALLFVGALKLTLWTLGVAFGIGYLVLVTLGPILLVGFVVALLIRLFSRNGRR